MKISLHRAAVAAATLAVSVGLALAPTAAQAAPSPQATLAAQWLAAQVPSGTHLFESVYGPGEFDHFVDYGLNLDLQYALDVLGESSTADQVYGAVIADTAAYTDSFGTRYAGAIGKLATYVRLHGDDPSNIDGRDLIADLEALMVTDGAEAGRLKDTPDGPYQSANTINQSWGVRALVGAGSDAADVAEDFLADQQCDDGGFRLYQGSTCASSVDATTFAIQALQDAGGFSAELAEADNYLADQQASDGSLSEVGAANSNSTGLAALSFASLGNSAAATKAADWVALRQAKASTSGLEDEAGAIAYGPAEFEAGASDGIDDIERDQWVRATAQAALALNFATQSVPETEPGPTASLQLKVSDSTPAQGQTITVTATGKDASGTSTGDVSDDLSLNSSVESDTVEGNTVKFNHASPHTITATHVPTGTTESITIEVSPLVVDNPTGESIAEPDTDKALPDTGSSVQPWQLPTVAGLLLLGAALVFGGRRRFVPAHVER